MKTTMCGEGRPVGGTFLFPSAPEAPSEYSFVDGEEAARAGMPRNGGVIGNRPPPPYVFGRISSHVYDMIDPKAGHEWMFRVALLELVWAVLACSCSVSCVVQIDHYCPYYTGVWVSAVFLINATLGVIAAKRATVNLFVAHLVSSVLAVVCSVILLALSVHNWNQAGYTERELCVLPVHNTDHLNKNVWYNTNYDYGQCLYHFKLGITFNVLHTICAVLEGVLSFVSTIFCFKSVCHCSNWRHSWR